MSKRDFRYWTSPSGERVNFYATFVVTVWGSNGGWERKEFESRREATKYFRRRAKLNKSKRYSKIVCK